jgi:3-oxoacyl-[acyl-carrier-protein] synthase III
MMMEQAGCVSILGVGHSLGDHVRGNDDSVFDYLREHPQPNSDLFAGLKYRRVLGTDQTVVSIMVDAAHKALADATLNPDDIDLLIGAASVSDYSAPNGLTVVHQVLKLPASCRALALNSEYTTFLDGMRIAHDMIASGSIRNALVACGVNWTQHMDYTQPICAAASDAAGAAVVGRSTAAGRFTLVDWENETQSSWYGALRMAPRSVPTPGAPTSQLFTDAMMTMDAERGRPAVVNFGIPVPPQVVARLLERNDLSASDITLVPHQTSATVAGCWKTAIAPALYVSTLEDLADMVSASVPVNLSISFATIPTNHVVLMGIGMEMHCTALLYSRSAP